MSVGGPRWVGGESGADAEVLDLTILIVNYRSAGYVRACVDSLREVSGIQIKIWENGSGPGEFALLEQEFLEDERVSLHESRTNLGFGAGVNRLVALSRAKEDAKLLILNPDTLASDPIGANSGLRRMAGLIDGGTVDLLCPLLTTGDFDDPEIWYHGGGLDTRRGISWHAGYGSELNSGGDEPPYCETQFATGAAMMLRRRTFDLLGGFDERFFLYWEDVDLSVRAKALGLSIGVTSEMQMWHQEGGSSEGQGRSLENYYYCARNRLLVCGPLNGYVTVLARAGLVTTLKSLVRPLFRERDHRCSKFLAVSRGCWDGVRRREGYRVLRK